MSAKLNNAPIVEVWFGLNVETNPDGLPWNLGVAEEFLSSYRNDFTDVEVTHSIQVQLVKSDGGLPRPIEKKIELERVRAFDPQRTRCLQVSNDRVVYNSLRPGKAYPGYDVVYQEVADVFANYVNFFRPLSIREASLCYVDIINIPIVDKPTIELSDYFKMSSDLPEEPFGPMTQYSIQVTFKCPVDEGPMVVTLRSLPGHPDQQFIRLHMEWQKHCVRVDTLNLEIVKNRLKRSKDYVGSCFEKSFTPAAWNLFEPESRME